jgi:hypothetical protein
MVTVVGLQHKMDDVGRNTVTIGGSGGITVIQLESRDMRPRKRLVGHNTTHYTSLSKRPMDRCTGGLHATDNDSCGCRNILNKIKK